MLGAGYTKVHKADMVTSLMDLIGDRLNKWDTQTNI